MVNLGFKLLSNYSKSLAIVSLVWAIAMIIPNIAVSTRRLHDIEKSGWWYLLNLIPIVGQIILIIWWLKQELMGIIDLVLIQRKKCRSIIL
jgi:uncharacterized membrane protein YhaH (DUF805 family)